ncbi:hypothetical protein YC2023_004814 [Brassica napus]
MDLVCNEHPINVLGGNLVISLYIKYSPQTYFDLGLFKRNLSLTSFLNQISLRRLASLSLKWLKDRVEKNDVEDSDDTQAPENSQFLETQLDFSCPPQFALECNTFKWKVQIRANVHANGEIEEQTLTTKEVWKLQNRRVIVHFDEDSGQPDEDSGGFLGSSLGQLSNDVNLLPIDYADWRVFAPHRKDKAWDIILNSGLITRTQKKNYVLSVLGRRCKDFKVRLWKMYKRNDRTETILNRPVMVPEDQWNGFKDQTGRTPCRAELFIASRKKSDGTFVCEEAKSRADELTLLMSENLSVERSNITASLDDEYSKLLKMSNTPNLEASNSDVFELKSQVSGLQSQVQNLAELIQQLVGATTVQTNGAVPNLACVLSNLANEPNFFADIILRQPKTEIMWIRATFVSPTDYIIYEPLSIGKVFNKFSAKADLLSPAWGQLPPL